MREVTLRPRRPVMSSLGRAVGWLALPWLAVALAVASIAIDSSALPVRILVLAVALAPTVSWIAARWGRPRNSPLLLAKEKEPRMEFDERGLAVFSNDTRTAFNWDDIGGLDASPRWFASRMLRDRDGVPLLAIPECLAAGRAASRDATAAECAVAVRPDLFRLEVNAALGLPLGFSRPAA
jgi:hypothetical protein